MPNNREMRKFVTELLQTRLQPFYYYHNYHHTLYVADKVVEIGNEENCTEYEIKLLTAAALWHDTGYINTDENHEEESCRLVQQYLPGYGFSPEEIKKICAMIMATKVPQSPENKLEEILVDADMEYLGTETAADKADDLFREMQQLDHSFTKKEWDRKQISFLQKHHFFTKFCKEKKESLKYKYLQQLIEKIE